MFAHPTPNTAAASHPDAETIENWMVQRLADELRQPAAEIDPNLHFTALGLDSVSLFSVTGDLATWLDRELPATLFWEYPTISVLAGKIAAEGILPDTAPRLESVPALKERSGWLPVSLFEERIWRVPMKCVLAWKIRGDVDVEALRRAVALLTTRHEIFRTRFCMIDGQPRRRIFPAHETLPAVEDLRNEARPAETAETRLHEEIQREIRPEHEDLLRALLYRLGDDHYELALILHHFAFDHWSVDHLAGELRSLYESVVNGEPLPPEPPLQAADFAVWQRQHQGSNSEVYRRQREYWCDLFGRGIEPFDLPHRPSAAFSKAQRAIARRFESKGLKRPTLETRLELHFQPGSHSAIKDFCKRQQVTSGVLCLGVFKHVLRQVTGREKIALATYSAVRSRPELAETIGFLINLLILSTDLQGADSPLEVVRRVSEVTTAALANQDVPYEEIATVMSERGAPLPAFPAVFQMLFPHERPLALGTAEVESLSIPIPCPAQGFRLLLMEKRDQFVGSLRYDSRFYSHDLMKTVGDRFMATLAETVR